MFAAMCHIVCVKSYGKPDNADNTFSIVNGSIPPSHSFYSMKRHYHSQSAFQPMRTCWIHFSLLQIRPNTCFGNAGSSRITFCVENWRPWSQCTFFSLHSWNEGEKETKIFIQLM